MNEYVMIKSDELYHHGILGQKWGVRRYQNADGTLTEAGRKKSNLQKYRMSKDQYEKHLNKRLNEADSRDAKTKIIREEQRDIAEGEQRHKTFRNIRNILSGIGGGAIGVTAGLLAPVPSFMAALVAGAGGIFGASLASLGDDIVEDIGQKYIYDERNSAKNNLLSTKLDDLNIDEDTKRRLNL